MSEDEIRRDERTKIAALLDANAEAIGEFARTPIGAVRLVALLVSLPFGSASES